MSYFVSRGASQRTKTFTSFALAAIMIFQAFGPGVFALKTAYAVDNTNTIDVCHKTGPNWNYLDTPNVNSYNAHIGHGDFDYVGPSNVSDDEKTAWCAENAPKEPPVEIDTATVTATKIVCDTETVLPNWGVGGPNIDATTAATFLAAHPNECQQVAWDFAWSKNGVGNPGDQVIGAGGAGWNGFAHSVATPIPAGERVWIREQFKNGYIPFGGQNTTASTSAEIYCGSDVLNFDNWEYIDTVAGGNYHCVAWNVETPGTPEEVEPCLIPVIVLPGDKITTIDASNGPEVTLQSVLDTQYPPANTVDDIDDETGIQAWNIPANTSSVTVQAKLLSASAGNTNELGYYFDGDTSTFVSLFTVPGNTPSIPDVPAVAIPTLGHTKIAFALKSGANVYASQYTLNDANEDHAAIYQPVTGTYAIAFEDLPFSSADKDYNDLVAEIKIVSCDDGTQCVPTSGMISSGTDTLVTDINGTPTAPNTPSVLVSTIPAIQALGAGVWGATTSDANAKWVWSEDMVSDWTVDKFVTFKKDFTVTGTPTNGTLEIASDNSYEVWVNGNLANPAHFADASEDNHSAIDTWNVTSLLVTGTNTLTIKVKNIGINVAQSNNPGGLLYTLSWASNCGGGGSSEEETSTITIHKYIDGQPATSEIAGETTFNVETTESSVGEVNNNWVGVRNLNDENNYTYVSNLLVDEHNTFIANEVIGGNIIGPNAECIPGKFKLGGYSYGPTLNDAFTAASSTSAHQFQNISSDQHVIVWNEACPTTAHITATKIVCTNEADLPNFGNGTGAPISSTTAADWISPAHPSCSLQPGWTFQWAPSGTSNPGDNTGAAGAPWTSTGATIANGTISFDVPVVTNGDYVWMREVMKPGYIPFTGQNTTQDVSAEIYCGVDHLNFDNYDRIDNLVAGNNYNCVAWNVPIEGNGGPEETKTFATTTIFATDLAANIPAVILTPTKWFFYNDETDAIDNALGSFVFGPNTAPLGNGSAQISVTGTQRRNIATYQFSNVKLSDIKALRFSTYSESLGNGSPASERSAYLNFNVSFDGVDSWQKRLVYVPSVNGVVTNDTWQSWDAIDGGNGLWLYSGATWPAPNAIPGTTPKTWTQILTDYPNIQTRTTDSWMGLRIGEPYNDGFTGEVDNFVIAIKSGLNTHTQTFDFEPTPRNEDCNDCGGGNGTPTITTTSTGGSGSRSGQQRGGSVAGASTSAPQVLGASTDLPGLPDTGNGSSSQALLIALTFIGAVIAVNAVAIRKMRNS